MDTERLVLQGWKCAGSWTGILAGFVDKRLRHFHGLGNRSNRLSPVDLSAMTHPQNNDLISGQIENHAIVADPEAVGSETRDPGLSTVQRARGGLFRSAEGFSRFVVWWRDLWHQGL